MPVRHIRLLPIRKTPQLSAKDVVERAMEEHAEALPVPPGPSVDELIEKAMQRSRERREAKKAKNTPSAWRKIFQDAMREKYPRTIIDYPAYMGPQLKAAIIKRGFPAEEMPQFLRDVVIEWPTLYGIVFPNKACGEPSLRLVIAMLSEFYGAWKQHTDVGYQMQRPLPPRVRQPKPAGTAPLPPPKRPLPGPSAAFLARANARPPLIKRPETKRVSAQSVGLRSWDEINGGKK